MQLQADVGDEDKQVVVMGGSRQTFRGQTNVSWSGGGDWLQKDRWWRKNNCSQQPWQIILPSAVHCSPPYSQYDRKMVRERDRYARESRNFVCELLL